MHRFHLSFWICVISSLWLACTPPSSPAPKPNLVFIMADQWRAQDVGYMGNEQVKTPYIDALAAESINLRTAIATTPVCAPTRASLLTGQFPLTHGLFYNDKPLMTEVPTLAEIYKQAGYQTGYIGKWHINGGPDHLPMHEVRDQPIPAERRRGFDFWRVYECTHDYHQSVYYDEVNRRHEWEGYDAFAQTQTAMDYLQEHKDTSFVLFLSWGPPHAPYQTAPEPYQQIYDSVDIALRPNVPDSLAERAQRAIKGYYAHMSALDDAIAKLQESLRSHGLEENTIFVFTSDHGDMLYSQGMVKKQKPWDESIRVPFLLKYPAAFGREGKALDVPLGTPDILPTLLSLSGLDIPETVEGQDFSGYLQGGMPPDTARLIMCPVPFHQWKYSNGGREYRGIRTPRYTYVRDLQGPWLLYDNQKDPYQLVNLCNLSEHAALQAQLDQLLQARLEATQDEFLPAQAYMDQWHYRWYGNDSLRAP